MPEIASRHHLELLGTGVAGRSSSAGVTLDEIELVAATRGPGLVAALLVGFSAAKALAAARRLPFAPVDHLHGHSRPASSRRTPFEPPFLCLIASGGHTLLADVTRPRARTAEVLGQTLDDAAGEAFDKGARLLGLGYPGGPALERLARDGDPEAFEFPDRRPDARPRLLVRRAEDRAPLQDPRPGGGRGRAPSGRPGRLLPARDRRGADDPGRAGAGADRARAGWRWAAASPPTARCASAGRPRRRARHPARGAVHRQRGDDRQRRPVRAGRSRSRNTWSSTSTPAASGRRCRERRDPIVTLYGRPGLPSVRRGARGDRAGARGACLRARRAGHRDRRRAAARATWSGSRW